MTGLTGNKMRLSVKHALSQKGVSYEKDLDKLTAVLKKALLDHEKFYKVFIDTLLEVGKA